jgi:hypothetical protein
MSEGAGTKGLTEWELPTCFLCLEGGPGLLPMGCACRGPSMHWAVESFECVLSHAPGGLQVVSALVAVYFILSVIICRKYA